jgi:hypothetical protein
MNEHVLKEHDFIIRKQRPRLLRDSLQHLRLTPTGLPGSHQRLFTHDTSVRCLHFRKLRKQDHSRKPRNGTTLLGGASPYINILKDNESYPTTKESMGGKRGMRQSAKRALVESQSVKETAATKSYSKVKSRSLQVLS